MPPHFFERENDMKIVEALKELKTLDKRITKQCEKITLYASGLEGQPAFESDSEQEREVQALIQSNKDLIARRTELRLAIYKTNLSERIDTVLGNITIAEAIILRDGSLNYYNKTYESLNDKSGGQKFNDAARLGVDAANPPRLKRYYKESVKNDELSKYEAFKDQIDGILEVVNAERELLV